MRLIFFFWLFILPGVSYNQSLYPNEKLWRIDAPVAVTDFRMETDAKQNASSIAQFSIDYRVGSVDFFSKNLNKRVENYMVRDASWIDQGASNLDQLLYYQQVNFNLAEVYARRFRKYLFENRKQLIKGAKWAEPYNQEIMSDYSEEKARFELESDGGNKQEILDQWAEEVLIRLKALAQYDYDYEGKLNKK